MNRAVGVGAQRRNTSLAQALDEFRAGMPVGIYQLLQLLLLVEATSLPIEDLPFERTALLVWREGN